MTIFVTRTALPITSGLRFWPWGPLGTRFLPSERFAASMALLKVLLGLLRRLSVHSIQGRAESRLIPLGTSNLGPAYYSALALDAGCYGAHLGTLVRVGNPLNPDQIQTVTVPVFWRQGF